jgi:DNA-binding Lrp family transcriptional regulator
MNAFIFIITERGKHWEIIKNILKIEGVMFAHAVTGEFDIIVYVNFINIPQLSKIIDMFQTIDGIVRTTTAIAMAPRLDDSPK